MLLLYTSLCTTYCTNDTLCTRQKQQRRGQVYQEGQKQWRGQVYQEGVRGLGYCRRSGDGKMAGGGAACGVGADGVVPRRLRAGPSASLPHGASRLRG